MINLENIPESWLKEFQKNIGSSQCPTIKELTDPESIYAQEKYAQLFQEEHPAFRHIDKEVFNRYIVHSIIYTHLISEGVITLRHAGKKNINALSLLRGIRQSFESADSLDVFIKNPSYKESLSYFCNKMLFIDFAGCYGHSDLILRNFLSALVRFKEGVDVQARFIAEFLFANQFELSLNDVIVICNLVSDVGFGKTSEKIDETINSISFGELSLDKINYMMTGLSQDFDPAPIIFTAISSIGMQDRKKEKREGETSIRFFNNNSMVCHDLDDNKCVSLNKPV